MSAAEPLVFDRRVFIDTALPRVINTYYYPWFEPARRRQRIRCLSHAPIVPLDKRSFRIKKVLAVLHIKHGEPACPLRLIHWGKIDKEIVVFLHQPGDKVLFFFQACREGAWRGRLGLIAGGNRFRRHSIKWRSDGFPPWFFRVANAVSARSVAICSANIIVGGQRI